MHGPSNSKNPREGASWLSVMLFWWMNDVLKLGNKQPLTENDLFRPLEDFKAEVLIDNAEEYWLEELKKSEYRRKKPRLWKAMARVIPWKSRLVMILINTLQSLSFVFLPVCLWLVLKTLNDGPSIDIKYASIYVVALGITCIVKALTTQHYDYLTELWGLKLKVALIGLVYKKVLSLSRCDLETKLSGNTINLVSNDAQKIEKSLQGIGYILVAPLEMITTLSILWYLIGWKSLVGAAVFIALAVFQMLMARKAATLRKEAAAFTDKRLVVMNEIISGIRAVKMHAWEWNFREIVCNLRRKERAVIRIKGFIMSMLLALMFTTLPIVTLVSVTTLAMTGTHLTSFAIFTLLLCFISLRSTICFNLSLEVEIASDGKEALDRIQTFLTEEVAKFEGIGEHHSQNLSIKQKVVTKKESKMTVHLVSYLNRDGHLGEAQSGTSNPLSEAFTDQVTSEFHASNSFCKEPFVTISEASCSWNQDTSSDTLRDITFSVSNGDLLAITGAVGSGKSSLLTAILGELPLRTGTISCHGKLAYVPQIPWVFSGTVRENILFGLPFDEKRFQRVIQMCDLAKDLSSFTSGDLTEIGQRGVTLSGGQKARVGLARAVYSDADIYLLDDPLSAVDTKVGRKLFENCIIGHLSGRIRLLVTHQLQYLKNVNRIVVMENGSIVHHGAYMELLDRGALIGVEELPESYEDRPGLAESISVDELNDKRNIKEGHKGPLLSSFLLVEGQVDSDDAFELPINLQVTEGVEVQRVNDGRTSQSVSSLTPTATCDLPETDQHQNFEVKLAKPCEHGHTPTKSATLEESSDPEQIVDKVLHVPSDSMGFSAKRHAKGKDNEAFVEDDNATFVHNVHEKEGGDQKLSQSTNNDPSFMGGRPKGRDNEAFMEDSTLPKGENERGSVDAIDETILQITSSPVVPRMCDVSNNDSDQQSTLGLKEDEETKSAGTVTWRLYWKYFKEGLPVSRIIILAVALLFAQVCLLAPNWWLARMAEMSPEQQKSSLTHVIHGSLVAVSFLVMTASSFSFYYLLLKAAENLHSKLALGTIKAPVKFFDSTPTGRILNRFSKDIGTMDDVLPPLFLQALLICLFSLSAILASAATNVLLFLVLIPILAVFVYFARYYLKSSRELKRIETIKCSPVYSHLMETANGLEIVHTSNMNKTFMDRLDRYQDENTRAFFMVVSSNRWLSVRLDLLSGVFVMIVAVAAILVTENPALAGLALTYALQTLNATQYGVRSASEVENLMTSVERVMAYTEIDSEPGYSNETHPPESWPNEGNLSIEDLSLVYYKGGPRVLKEINVCISSEEKVGVVGRTGAGKSSLVSALFRMPDPLGKVLIDGVNIGTINLQEARRSMAVITQDPVLFGGTLKRNIDPFSEYMDIDLWTALEEVQLKTLVEDLPEQLEFKLKESGTNLSVGERQLLCLARALVQKSKIIIMDEATANVDFKTDRLIQEVIRDKFKDSTVLTIAHRLNTIMDYDKVLVLDGGRVVEFDKPEELIRKGGLFAEMVRSQDKSEKH